MNSTQEEEIESLRAIFCRDDEFTAEKDTDRQLITVNFDLCTNFDLCFTAGDEVERNSTNGSVIFSLTPEYPQTQQPKMDIRCSNLPASAIETIRQKVEETAATLQGQPMLLDLCYLTQELLEREIQSFQSLAHKADSNGLALQTKTPDVITERHLHKQKLCNIVSEVPGKLPDYNIKITDSKLECQGHKNSRTCQKDMKTSHNQQVHNSADQNFARIDNDSKVKTALLQLDHMRSKHSYIKLIKKWTVELGLTGRLIFCSKLIFILLQGTFQAIREYIVMNRTTIVDVDSKGRACKERMLTVLCEVPVESHERLSDFCVQELATFKALQELFHSFSMQDLYQDYVSNLIPISGGRITSSKQHRTILVLFGHWYENHSVEKIGRITAWKKLEESQRGQNWKNYSVEKIGRITAWKKLEEYTAWKKLEESQRGKNPLQ